MNLILLLVVRGGSQDTAWSLSTSCLTSPLPLLLEPHMLEPFEMLSVTRSCLHHWLRTQLRDPSTQPSIFHIPIAVSL